MARVAIVPNRFPSVVDAARRAGAEVVDAADAEAIVWTDPSDPRSLAATLAQSPATWVQLPFAGIERFVDAGVVTPDRTWTCAKAIYGEATAEQALALTLAAARLLHRHARATAWWSEGTERHRRLAGTTAVVVGAGGIGEAYARFSSPLGVRLLAVNRSGRPVAWAERTVPSSQLASIAPEADWLVVCAPATAETRHLVGRAVLEAMKPDAWLINVARGSLVDADALIDVLRERRIGGAALDVTDPEPLPPGSPLWSMDNVMITSHTANTAEMALPELAALVERNLRRFDNGEPLEGLVDMTLGY